MSNETFIADSIPHMIRKGISVDLQNKHFINFDGTDVNGYFYADKLELKCAVGKPEDEWFPVFVHEYCHFLQWREQTEAWKVLGEEEKRSETSIDEWLSGTDLDHETVLLHCKLTRDVEEECERFVVDRIRKYDLQIDISQYIQKTNAYLYFWSVLPDTRKWYTGGNAPYMIPEILERMPLYFSSDYDNIPFGFLDLVNEHCYK